MCSRQNAPVPVRPDDQPDGHPTPAPRPRTAWFHCFAGVAGDMTLGALVDAGADAAEVAATVAGLGVDGYALTFEPVLRCGLSATHANVVVHSHVDHDHDGDNADHDGDHTDHDHHDHDHGDHHHDRDHHDHGHGEHRHGEHRHGEHRPYRTIRALIDGADLPARVRDRAQRVFRELAEVEGAMHRMPPDDVEFHEVGALDALVDVVGVCAALESLGVGRIVCSPITTGHGTVRAAHGSIPHPAPAVAALFARRTVPVRGIDEPRELATPTGVALMTALADEFATLPAMHVEAVGYGAGTAEIDGRPNVVQVVLGSETAAAPRTRPAGQPAVELQANVDDVTGEVIAHTIAALLAAGAHDAWATPIVMKKGRPAHTVHALCDSADAGRLGSVLVAETGTLGLRGTTVERWPQHREVISVSVGGHEIRVKVSAHRVKAEYDDSRAAALALGVPVREVVRRAEHAAEQATATRTGTTT